MPNSNIRSRDFLGSLGVFKSSEDFGKTWKTTNGQTVKFGSQITESEGHKRLPNGNWSGGGPFSSVRIERSFPTSNRLYKSSFGPGERLCQCSIGTPIVESQLPEAYRNMTTAKFKGQHSQSLDADGATAISLVAPTNPNAELGTSLAEMYREGIPSLPGIRTWKRRTEIARAAADEFLNAEFGWLPLVHDVRSTADSVRHSRDILNQYSRDSGGNVRREFAFPVSHSESSGSSVKAFPTVIFTGSTGFPGWMNSTQGFGSMLMSQTIEVSSRKWFSGCFTYALPDRSDSWSRLHRNAADADKLFGTTLTPNVLWELTPWSWAVDWFTNTGDIIANATNFVSAGLVMRYGYMMEESIVKITNSFTGARDSTNSSWGSVPSSSYIMTAKRRVGANAFGFGVSSGSLSATQIAIAAALGILLL